MHCVLTVLRIMGIIRNKQSTHVFTESSMLKIFNTMTRQKRVNLNLSMPGKSACTCGITVYDLCHIGHGRTFVAFDVVSRYLRFLGYNLKYVRNITDIDDKIIKRANENGESFVALVDRMIAEMQGF